MSARVNDYDKIKEAFQELEEISKQIAVESQKWSWNRDRPELPSVKKLRELLDNRRLSWRFK